MHRGIRRPAPRLQLLRFVGTPGKERQIALDAADILQLLQALIKKAAQPRPIAIADRFYGFGQRS
ncbi:MAG TPA: hypothetical protein VKE49_13260, partial [Myxococcaceae bacterium]|nr:hypothetical protein [Myxococcaceae bacterium]